MPVKTRKISINGMKGCSLIYFDSASSGNRPNSIWEPSSGAKGIRLNVPNTKFKSIAKAIKASAKEPAGKIPTLKSKVKKNARKKLVVGPEAPINNMSFFGFLRLK